MLLQDINLTNKKNNNTYIINARAVMRHDSSYMKQLVRLTILIISFFYSQSYSDELFYYWQLQNYSPDAPHKKQKQREDQTKMTTFWSMAKLSPSKDEALCSVIKGPRTSLQNASSRSVIDLRVCWRAIWAKTKHFKKIVLSWYGNNTLLNVN